MAESWKNNSRNFVAYLTDLPTNTGFFLYVGVLFRMHMDQKQISPNRSEHCNEEGAFSHPKRGENRYHTLIQTKRLRNVMYLTSLPRYDVKWSRFFLFFFYMECVYTWTCIRARAKDKNCPVSVTTVMMASIFYQPHHT